MDLELANKVVLITGGSKGIGLACARAFLQEGAKVAIVSRQQANLENAIQALGGDDGRLSAHAADLRDAAEAQRVTDEVEQRHGVLDILVNSAGAAQRYAPEELNPQAWRDAMDAKYFTYINAMDAVLRRMAARKAGVIVNIIGAGGRVASPVHLPGGAANAALMLASAGLAHAFGAQGIRVNAVNPGPTLTERLQGRMDAQARSSGCTAAEVEAQMAAEIPLGRFALPGEVADTVLYLASARASYVTGSLITMDGAKHPLGA